MHFCFSQDAHISTWGPFKSILLPFSNQLLHKIVIFCPPGLSFLCVRSPAGLPPDFNEFLMLTYSMHPCILNSLQCQVAFLFLVSILPPFGISNEIKHVLLAVQTWVRSCFGFGYCFTKPKHSNLALWFQTSQNPQCGSIPLLPWYQERVPLEEDQDQDDEE